MYRRELLKSLAAVGIGTPVFQRALVSLAQESQDDEAEVTAEMIKQAEWIAGLELEEEERDTVARSVNRQQQSIEAVRQLKIDYGTSPAVVFQPLKADSVDDVVHERAPEIVDPREPDPQNDEELAFLPVSQLAKLIKKRTITSTELTKLYLARLEKYNPVLNCVVSLTKDLALKQAAKADAEIKAGDYRGPLHGIPWGAKDLISVPGYKTTWGAPQFAEQMFDEKATVAERLEEAGAVLVAKLSLGALAMGDQWFGGRTNNPWNPDQGSSGSSAGSASAVVAGLCGFTIGTETLGSIVSPSRRCGATGLRPTFGRVSRAGCMPLSWTMDKLGPICRSIEDCAIVFAAIQGRDGKDPSVVDQPFVWPNEIDLSQMKVGFVRSRRRRDTDESEEVERPEITILKELGVELVEIELPNDIPARAIASVLDVEAATVFDDLTRRNDTDGLNAWGNIFRTAEFMPAVEYLRAMRGRRKLMEAMEEAIAGVDCYINGQDLVITNLTGHPSTVMPFGYRERDGQRTPYSITMTGQLYGEAELLALSLAFQNKLDAHLQHPPMEAHLKAMTEAKEASDG